MVVRVCLGQSLRAAGEANTKANKSPCRAPGELPSTLPQGPGAHATDWHSSTYGISCGLRA
jgi:hypothetical protein